MRRFLFIVLAILAIVVLVPLGVVNRQLVTLNLDLFGRAGTPLAMERPLSLFLFLAFLLGVVIGGLVSWWGQGKYRSTARQKSREAFHWKAQADRLAREMDPNAPPAGATGKTGRLGYGR